MYLYYNNNIIMEYQRINLLCNTPNQPSKFKAKNWVEINDGAHGTYNTNSQIKFKTATLKSSLYDYSDAYIFVKGAISITAAAGGATNNNDIKLILKNYTPFTDCLNKINNTQVDKAKYIDVVMQLYNLIEYSDNYSKTSGSLWQYYRDEVIANSSIILGLLLILLLMIIVNHLNLNKM